jgi:Tol biopolymer transport system component
MKLNRQTNTFEPFLEGIAAECIDYSPDGQWIAYVSWPNGELWKSKTDGSSKELLEDGLIAYMPRWSPVGSRIAFAAKARDAAEAAQPFRIYTISAGGGRPEPVAGVLGAAFTPSWSPDGKRLAFAPNYLEGSKEEQHVSIVNLETGAVETVPGSENLFSESWSPDGNSLAAFTYAKFWPVVYSFGTQKWSVLRESGGGFPRWSRDSRYLYLGLGPADLVRIEIATRKVEEIHKVTEFARTGVLSPGVSWTPDDEPIVLKDLTTSQVYRIDRDR